MSEVRHCRSCNAAVRFIPSAKTGKLMILDAEPVPDGNVVINDGKAQVLSKELMGIFAGILGEPEAASARYRDHHSTCPDAAKYRRKKK